MKLLELKEMELSIDMFPRRKDGEDPVRSKGVHLTDIIKDLMEVSGISKTVSGTMWGNDELELAAQTGFIWEDFLSMVLKDRLPCRIGEVELDGIIMSPDGIEFDNNEEVVLSEYKLVWSSSRRPPTDNWKWMSQIKGYCKGLNLVKVNMYILYLNGDWKPPMPQYKGFQIEFTPLEIQENWEMLLNHARRKRWI